MLPQSSLVVLCHDRDTNGYLVKLRTFDLVLFFDCANVLSLKGKLVQLSEPRVMNDLLSLVAAQLRMNSAEPHQGQRIDDIDAKLNYRRIQDLGDFKGQDVFKLLGVPIYHTDGSNSRDLEELSELEKAIQLSLAEVTSVSAEKALSKEENGLCVFYWNGSFDTICRKMTCSS
ncbi:hypothetical protein D8674_000621 [Pyrus ussuriensis x Pyrus communis]|uniref:Uncharacterized protein n=1 Tax=Pyrus ussuriensis x Pyrus communis TaxID=2448454 RepID=A0A5N5F6J6_9ROSA|nr:hypothetical protein D8674_000621 [Pyrus ussuriensis x Pyrus communis]